MHDKFLILDYSNLQVISYEYLLWGKVRYDLIVRHVKLTNQEELKDIGILNGLIEEITDSIAHSAQKEIDATQFKRII